MLGLKEKRKAVVDRFCNKITHLPENDCWLWSSSLNNKGYGQFEIANKLELAHRVSWELFIGPIGKGICVLHKCDVRNCVNPDHLFLGNLKDNMQDCSNKGRLCVNLPFYSGEKHGMSKLTDEKVRQIRMLLSGGKSQRGIAKMFEISQSQICEIGKGRGWKHVC